jgi:hypothetical protein
LVPPQAKKVCFTNFLLWGVTYRHNTRHHFGKAIPSGRSVTHCDNFVSVELPQNIFRLWRNPFGEATPSGRGFTTLDFGHKLKKTISISGHVIFEHSFLRENHPADNVFRWNAGIE